MLAKILGWCFFVLLLPLFLILMLCYGIYYLVYSPVERRKYAASGCPEPYYFLITKSLTYAVETACLSAGYEGAHCSDEGELDCVWPREDVALLIVPEHEQISFFEESERISVQIEIEDEYIDIDLLSCAENITSEKGCCCAIVYRKEELAEHLTPENMLLLKNESLFVEFADLPAWLERQAVLY